MTTSLISPVFSLKATSANGGTIFSFGKKSRSPPCRGAAVLRVLLRERREVLARLGALEHRVDLAARLSSWSASSALRVDQDEDVAGAHHLRLLESVGVLVVELLRFGVGRRRCVRRPRRPSSCRSRSASRRRRAAARASCSDPSAPSGTLLRSARSSCIVSICSFDFGVRRRDLPRASPPA